MPRHVAFLRGINLGRRRLKMDELAAAFEGFGVDDVATYLASGNVVFTTGRTDLSALERDLERHLESNLGYPVDTFVRPLAALTRLLEAPGVVNDSEEGFRPHVIFMKDRVDDSATAGLAALETPDDVLRPLGREVLWLRRGGMADAPISTADLVRALGGTCTQRTLNTVRRLVAKFG